MEGDKYIIKNKVYRIVFNTREKNKAEMGVINCQQGTGVRNKCNGPEVETFLDAQTKSRIAETDQERRRIVRGESQRPWKPDHKEAYRPM